MQLRNHIIGFALKSPVRALLLRQKALSRPVRRRFYGNGRKGFSLTEVVLALGIVAFAFIPVLGLLPVGLDASRQAIDATIEAQIVQQLSNEAFQTDFSSLDELSTAPLYYFDYQGNKTTADKAIYTAGFVVDSQTDLPDSVSTTRLATVAICILTAKAAKLNNEPDPGQNPDSRKSIILLSDNGR